MEKKKKSLSTPFLEVVTSLFHFSQTSSTRSSHKGYCGSA